ncbi:hypothetical protein SELMODRAFT_417696 [Selaginella moellendorffii]|uniref:Uncharacterized protein n=1 Tax=Selaginella moellendorffii TaxID=88036 RepID=D8S3A6_SELML|nr:hypothetical protein SELMODRAFT_417696 [Selaginella moellendorffii]
MGPLGMIGGSEENSSFNHTKRYFKVLVFLLGDFDHYWLFNSLSREWRRCQFTSKKSIDDLAADDKGPWLGSSMFASPNRQSLKITGCYDRVKVKFPSNLFSCGLPCIVDYNGRWILVSSTISGGYKVSAAAWELDRETTDWKLLSEVYVGDLVKNGALEFEYFVVKHSVVVRPNVRDINDLRVRIQQLNCQHGVKFRVEKPH